MVPQISCPSSATSAKPKRIPKVPTTFSLATSPVMAATAACQLPQPRGAKIQEIPLPITARSPSDRSSTIPKLPSTNPKLDVNQMKMVESRITVPAFLIKDQPRSHMLRSTLTAVGIW